MVALGNARRATWVAECLRRDLIIAMDACADAVSIVCHDCLSILPTLLDVVNGTGIPPHTVVYEGDRRPYASCGSRI